MTRFCALLFLLLSLGFVPALEVKEISEPELELLWKELWAGGADTGLKDPILVPLSESDILEKFLGKWITHTGPNDEALQIELTDDRKAVMTAPDKPDWKNPGEWRVMGGRLILILQKEQLPIFIFHNGKHLSVFDPWAGNFQSRLERPKPSVPEEPEPEEKHKVLEEKIILETLARLDRAFSNRHLASLMRIYSSDARFHSTLEVEGEIHKNQYDRDKRERTLEESFKHYREIEMRRKVEKIEIAADGQSAEVISNLKMEFEFKGEKSQSHETETLHIKLVDGRPLISSSEIRIQILPSPKNSAPDF